MKKDTRNIKTTGSGEWSCPEGYILQLNETTDVWECCLIEQIAPIYEDVIIPIDLKDEFYFKDISWTVSYDPKSNAWISFHDWHPELCFPSTTHFLTTKTIELDEPECPPGWSWNPSIQMCELAGSQTLPALINTDETLPSVTGDTGQCEGGETYWDENNDMASITSIWTRFCVWARHKVSVSLASSLGPYLETGLNPANITMNGVPSGEVSNAPGTFFERDSSSYQSNWSGSTGPNVRDLGDHAINVLEGENHNSLFLALPGCPTPLPSVWEAPNRYFYYNTVLQKYIVMWNVGGASNGWATTTFNPTENTTYGNPSAAELLTTTTNWANDSLTLLVGGVNARATVDANMNLILADVKASSPLTGLIRCTQNSALFNGFYSVCGFNDYELEVTIGSINYDNDSMGIVLAAFKDTLGTWGAVNQTHYLMLDFNQGANGSTGAMTITYNRGQEAFAFVDGGASQSSSTVLSTEFTPFARIAPLGGNGWGDKGYARIRIEKSGMNIKVYTTKTMSLNAGTIQYNAVYSTIGDNNPYVNLETGVVGDPTIDFDLDDPATWTGYTVPNNPINDPGGAPSYADPSALLKFENNCKIGFFTWSQRRSEFFDLFFDGYAVPNTECNCPEGYTKVYKDPATGWFTEWDGNCVEGEILCRKVECECPPAPYTPSTLVESGVCDDLFLTSADGASGSPNYINQNPKTCQYDYLQQLPGSLSHGSIWKHNQRCDSFANYYGVDYPWEIELVESTGQAVNTVRNLEYQLECFVYKGNELNNYECGDDRWHDLDFNFDEAVIYNTEQVSGLLLLNLKPKQDPITALQYPIIGPQDIQILYTKEEQKYRFNQFWDITADRGEFTPTEQQIWITELNGYIKDFNIANLNYNKVATQRKKFRHYYNKAILRRRISGNRKMLLKLVNTKLNFSFR
jgi:hypothetical protein